MWASAIGFGLIFAKVWSFELKAQRWEQGCEAGELRSCFELCVKRPELQAPCVRVHRACIDGDDDACGAVRYLQARPPRPRF